MISLTFPSSFRVLSALAARQAWPHIRDLSHAKACQQGSRNELRGSNLHVHEVLEEIRLAK